MSVVSGVFVSIVTVSQGVFLPICVICFIPSLVCVARVLESSLPVFPSCLECKLDLFHVVLCIAGTNQWVISVMLCPYARTSPEDFPIDIKDGILGRHPSMAVTSGSNLTLYRSKERLEDTVGTVGAPRNWNPCSGRPQRCQLVLSVRSPDEFVVAGLKAVLAGSS